jgi:hypothetical protein
MGRHKDSHLCLLVPDWAPSNANDGSEGPVFFLALSSYRTSLHFLQFLELQEAMDQCERLVLVDPLEHVVGLHQQLKIENSHC